MNIEKQIRGDITGWEGDSKGNFISWEGEVWFLRICCINLWCSLEVEYCLDTRIVFLIRSAYCLTLCGGETKNIEEDTLSRLKVTLDE